MPRADLMKSTTDCGAPFTKKRLQCPALVDFRRKILADDRVERLQIAGLEQGLQFGVGRRGIEICIPRQ